MPVYTHRRHRDLGSGLASSKQLQFEAKFHRLVHAPQLLGCFAQRVWSRFVTLCRGGAHYATKSTPVLCMTRKSGTAIAGPAGPSALPLVYTCAHNCADLNVCDSAHCCGCMVNGNAAMTAFTYT